MSFVFSFLAYKNTPFPKQYTILSNKWGAVQKGDGLFLLLGKVFPGQEQVVQNFDQQGRREE